MKYYKKIIFFSFLISLPLSSLADCELLSAEPILLKADTLSVEQLATLSEQMDSYIESLTRFIDCQENEQGVLNTEDENYQQQFEDYSMKIEQVMDRQALVIDNYNRLVESVVESVVESNK